MYSPFYGDFMKVLILKNAEAVASFTANYVIEKINAFVPTKEKPYFVLGLPTGSTPIPVYQMLVKAYQEGEVSFKNVVTFNMDEYKGLPAEHDQSYHYFMQENLFKHIDIPSEQVHILDGMALDTKTECKNYEEKIKSFGGIDIQLAGIGENGHLAFNEPGTSFDSLTHLQKLTDDTIEVNSRFFAKKEDVPQYALTVGLKTVYDAKEVFVLATGDKKANAIYQSIRAERGEDCPASILQEHKGAFFVCDEGAAKKLK